MTSRERKVETIRAFLLSGEVNKYLTALCLSGGERGKNIYKAEKRTAKRGAGSMEGEI